MPAKLSLTVAAKMATMARIARIADVTTSDEDRQIPVAFNQPH
jgi:hypothetical protein